MKWGGLPALKKDGYETGKYRCQILKTGEYANPLISSAVKAAPSVRLTQEQCVVEGLGVPT